MSGLFSNSLLFQISTAIYMLLDVSAVILNGLLAYVLKRYNKTNVITFWFIYCLSLSDIMVGAVELVQDSLMLQFFLSPKRTHLASIADLLGNFSNFFFALSGRMILVIAVDRCIHMKYLIRYSTIMTKFRAGVIVLINVTFGIVLVVPPLIVPNNSLLWFHTSFTIFNTACTFMIYFIYIKTYFTIKRQVATLQLQQESPIVAQDTSDNRNQCEGKLLNEDECMRLEKCQKFNTTEDSIGYKPFVIKNNTPMYDSRQDAIVLPITTTIIPSNLDDNHKGMESKTERSDVVKHLTDYQDRKTHLEHEERMERKQPAKNEGLKTKIGEKSQRKIAKPEIEFRRATFLILITLLMCYTPTFIDNFYSHATGNQIMIFSVVSHSSVLLNSSLNVIILVVCNREIKRNIKSIVFHA